MFNACADPEGGRGSSQNPVLGHNRSASETPFKWHFAGGPTMTRL